MLSLAFVVNVCEKFPRPQSTAMRLSVVLQITATLFVKKSVVTVFTISAKVLISRLCHFCQSASSFLEGHHYQIHWPTLCQRLTRSMAKPAHQLVAGTYTYVCMYPAKSIVSFRTHASYVTCQLAAAP